MKAWGVPFSYLRCFTARDINTLTVATPQEAKIGFAKRGDEAQAAKTREIQASRFYRAEGISLFFVLMLHT